MIVNTKAPRQRSFIAFKTPKEAARWIRRNTHRFIDAKVGLCGYVFVNHYVR